MASANLTRFAWLSIGAAILIIALKTTAYWLTGSVGLLSGQRGHDLLEQLERDIRAAIPGAQLFTHLEAQGDPAAWEDIALDRKDSAAGSKNN
jgi:divalent metal cation (Fe/Co/Zn/Cd) transporter